MTAEELTIVRRARLTELYAAEYEMCVYGCTAVLAAVFPDVTTV